jgi:transcriptional regulator of acetoin/glycerol metabolism
MTPQSDCSATDLQLVVVRRDKFATFGLLAQTFANEPNVRLMWDRRVRERRRPTASNGPDDRRRRDRRRTPSTKWTCGDYLLVNVAKSATLEAAENKTLALKSQLGVPDFEAIKEDIEAAVTSDLAVLISGGDSYRRMSLARQIHGCSDRRDRKLLIVDSETFMNIRGASDQPEKIGTIFIDELANLDWTQQSHLSILLERQGVETTPTGLENLFDARIISGTKHDLFERVESGQFQADLFYRLNLIHLVLDAD